MSRKKRPPRLAEQLLKAGLSREDTAHRLGDFEEVYQRLHAASGAWRARTWYWSQVLRSLPKIVVNSWIWSMDMMLNYLKLALRNLFRKKGYALINISGLAVGMACCLLICIYIVWELSFDRYHTHAGRIYRIAAEVDLGGNQIRAPLSSAPMGPHLSDNFPEVKDAVRFRPRPKTAVRYQDKEFNEGGIFVADSSVFRVFSFSLLQGSPDTALQNPYSVVLTKEAALKYFGRENPLGRTLKFDNLKEYNVTGVLDEIPGNSHFSFDMLCSFESLYADGEEELSVWFYFNTWTYLLLEEGIEADSLESKFPALVEERMGSALKAIGGRVSFFLQPLTRIHLFSHLEREIAGNSDIAYIYLFGAVALFILFIACINFMNLSTARSANRAREVGLRKVLGSSRAQLVKQFLGESVIFCLFALAAALILVRVGFSVFQEISGVEFFFPARELPRLIPGLLGFSFLVGILAGLYPAFYLSSFRPVSLMKGRSGAASANARMRNFLVVFQFAVSIGLIIGTGVVARQIRYIKSKHLGFNRDHVLTVYLKDPGTLERLEMVKTELLSLPGILRVGASSQSLGQVLSGSPYVPEGFADDESQLLSELTVDPEFIPVLEMELTAGRNFSKEFTSDRTKAVIINETAVRKFGWDNPVGKVLKAPGATPTEWREQVVIGVVRDFHFESLRMAISPLVMKMSPGDLSALSIRIRADNVSETLAGLKSVWKKIQPGLPFDYEFLDYSYDSLYRSEERLSRIFSAFTFLAVFIACLGLFGLAAYIGEQRTKEVGVRKILGASTSGIIGMLVRDFSRWVLIANVLAWPAAYLVMSRWLQNFAYRAGFNVWLFIFSGLLTLAIALLTVGFQALKAASANPADVLRHE